MTDESIASSEFRLPGDGEPENQEASVALIVSDDGNRRVLRNWLRNRYDVVAGDDQFDRLRQEGAVDLCLLDPTGFERHRDVLVTCKEQREPRILPYLLVRPKETASVDPEVHQYTDDVVITPTSTRELTARVEALLHLRELSLELAHANSELQAKNEELEYLMGAAAHDLRNPLQVAKLHTEEPDDGDSSDPVRTALNRMERLVDGLLAINRTQKELTTENMELVDFPAVVRECWEMIPAERAELDVSAAAETRVQAEPNLLRQLVENLLRNAVEHGTESTQLSGEDTPVNGTDSVTIRVGVEQGGFHIADDGPGISSEERDVVFDQGYSTNAGNGLGLAIARRVVESQGWQIRITDSVLGGARFEIAGVEIDSYGEGFQ